jgi:isocitrate dehydrogenase
VLTLDRLSVPKEGHRIEVRDGRLLVPDDPIIPFIEGDGTGPDIWRATRRILDAAVQAAYGGKRRVVWFEVYAGEQANREFGEWLPADTLRAFEHFVVGIKGPLTTPVGAGSVPSTWPCGSFWTCTPVSAPCGGSRACRPRFGTRSKVDMVVFRENTEDI